MLARSRCAVTISHGSFVLMMGPKQAWDWPPQSQVLLARWPPGQTSRCWFPEITDYVLHPWGTSFLPRLVTLVASQHRTLSSSQMGGTVAQAKQ